MKTEKRSNTGFEILNPKTLYNPTPYGYSHIASIHPNSKLVFVAGQGGEDVEGNIHPDFRTQVKQAFENIKKALKDVGLDMTDIVKLTTLIVDHDASKHQILTEESGLIWSHQIFPVQTLIPVPKLALEEMLFEIDAIAVKA